MHIYSSSLGCVFVACVENLAAYVDGHTTHIQISHIHVDHEHRDYIEHGNYHKLEL
jgi:hypothetical protein